MSLDDLKDMIEVVDKIKEMDEPKPLGPKIVKFVIFLIVAGVVVWAISNHIFGIYWPWQEKPCEMIYNGKCVG